MTATATEAAALWEAKYSADQLRDLLKKGHAVKNDDGEPSYPIGDEEDLRRAIRAVGRGGGSHDRIRRHIIKRARALGKSDMIPDDWSSSGASPGAKESARLAEEVTLAEATRGRQPTGRRMRIKLIDSGWGSSGYYSPQVLAEAARAGVFGAGTHMYLDHPTLTEAGERPERSVRDLAGVFASDATYADGGLYAEVDVFPQYREFLAEARDAIGVSIRAAGTAEQGEAEGRTGMLITALTEGISVDFVTRAGRGGQILELLESARTELAEARNIGAWLESRLHLELTRIADEMYGQGRLSRDERIGLSSAVGDALDAFVQRIEADQPQLYKRDLWEDPADDSADMAETRIAPAPPAQPKRKGVSMSGDANRGAPAQGGATTQMSEAERLRQENTELKSKLAEAELKAAQLGDQARELAEAKTSLEEAKRENLRLRANDSARAKAVEALASSTLPETAHERVIAAVTGDHVPLNKEGSLDEAKLVEAIKAAIDSERRYLAKFAEEAGIGSVRGLGTSGSPDEMSEADLTAGLKDVFTDLGMPDDIAGLAAKGR